ncbi:MAG: T9SS type A sorting domain-containing protein [Bacteroidetes bacterium]|nr:T9SS type A sorting domain-containing protein [Bacteroidota bacterium]
MVAKEFCRRKQFAIVSQSGSGFTTLEFFATADNATISIYEITGKLVDTFNASTLPNTIASLNIPTAHLSGGVYMIQVDDGNNKRTVRLMVR